MLHEAISVHEEETVNGKQREIFKGKETALDCNVSTDHNASREGRTFSLFMPRSIVLPSHPFHSDSTLPYT